MVSVIIPVYNSERYLREALESVQSQTYQNIEIITIDDGSTDGSGSILHEAAKKDPRILLIEKCNSGVSDSRNRGIDAAHGQYICFVDSDDIIEPDYIERMIYTALDNNAEMVVCGYSLMDKRGKKREIDIKYKSGNIAGQTGAFRELLDSGLAYSSCNKLIQRSILEKYNIRFSSGATFDEDMFFSWRVASACKNVHYCPCALYRYRLIASSSTMRYHAGLYEYYLREFTKLESFLVDNGLMYDSMLEDCSWVLSSKKSVIVKMIARSPLSNKGKIAKIQTVIDDDRIDCKSTPSALLRQAYIAEIILKLKRWIR